MDCPRCGHPQPDAVVDCIACGVILAKARPLARAATAPASHGHADTFTRATSREGAVDQATPGEATARCSIPFLDAPVPGHDARPRHAPDDDDTDDENAPSLIRRRSHMTGRTSSTPGIDDDADDDGAGRTLIDHAGRVLFAEDRADPVTAVGRGIVLLLLMMWTWTFATSTILSNAAGRSFLHLINLPFHEAGHILFIPLGQFMSVLGGSLFQVLLPAALTIVFLTQHRDPFGAAVTTWWTGENLVDLAPYINDARALQLVLIGGKTGAEVEGHDWERILMTFGWLAYDHTLARLAHATGVVIMFAAIGWGATVLVRHWRRSRLPATAPG